MEEDFEEREGEEKLSVYNSAGFIAQRLHNICLDCNTHKRSGAYSLWNGDLDAYWCELAGDVKPDGDEEVAFKKLNEGLGKVGPIQNWNKQTSFEGISQDLLKKKAEQYQKLIDKELFLRRLQNKQGKGTKYRDDADDYMDV